MALWCLMSDDNFQSLNRSYLALWWPWSSALFSCATLRFLHSLFRELFRVSFRAASMTKSQSISATVAGMDVGMEKMLSAVNEALFGWLVLPIYVQFPQHQEPAYDAARASLVHEVIVLTGLTAMCLMACAPDIVATNEIMSALFCLRLRL